MSAKSQLQVPPLPPQSTQLCSNPEPQFSHLSNGANVFRFPEEASEISRGALASALSLGAYSVPGTVLGI